MSETMQDVKYERYLIVRALLMLIVWGSLDVVLLWSQGGISASAGAFGELAHTAVYSPVAFLVAGFLAVISLYLFVLLPDKYIIGGMAAYIVYGDWTKHRMHATMFLYEFTTMTVEEYHAA